MSTTTAPDFHVDPYSGESDGGYGTTGVPVWLDITDEPEHPCDLAEYPTDYAESYECAGTAERRYGDYRVCNYHFERGAQWAIDDHAEALAEEEQLRREGRFDD